MMAFGVYHPPTLQEKIMTNGQYLFFVMVLLSCFLPHRILIALACLNSLIPLFIAMSWCFDDWWVVGVALLAYLIVCYIYGVKVLCR